MNGKKILTCAICREFLLPGEQIVCKDCRTELEKRVADKLHKEGRKVG